MLQKKKVSFVRARGKYKEEIFVRFDSPITLHLSKAQASVPSTTFQRLTRELCHWPTRTRVDLVVHHVLETLIVTGEKEKEVQKRSDTTTKQNQIKISRWSKKDASVHQPARVSMKHGFIATKLISRAMQFGAVRAEVS